MIIYALVSAAALGLVLSQVVRIYATHAKSVIMSDLGEEVPEFSQAANLRPTGESIYSFSRSYLATHSIATQHILLIHIFGHNVLGSVNSSKIVKDSQVASYVAYPPKSTQIKTIKSRSSEYLLLGSPITEGGKTVGSLVAVTSLAGLNSQESQVLWLAGFEALVALVFSIVAGFFFMRRVMKTVGKVTSAAVEISRGDLDRRLDYVGQSDEVGRLAMAFDEMITRISDTLDSQRRLLADVSHQLKTPLTVIRGNLELLQRNGVVDKAEIDEVVEVVIAETDYMKAMLDGLLLLERMSEAEPLNFELVDLRSFLADVFASALALGRRQWHFGDVPDIGVFIDSQKLRGAILNLLDNATKATSEGQEITLSASLDDKVLKISVTDSGAGIDSEDISRIFERFERGAPNDQRGAGLGLAIVKAVADAHGGGVEVNSAKGHGATFVVQIPRDKVSERTGADYEHCDS